MSADDPFLPHGQQNTRGRKRMNHTRLRCMRRHSHRYWTTTMMNLGSSHFTSARESRGLFEESEQPPPHSLATSDFRSQCPVNRLEWKWVSRNVVPHTVKTNSD